MIDSNYLNGYNDFYGVYDVSKYCAVLNPAMQPTVIHCYFGLDIKPSRLT